MNICEHLWTSQPRNLVGLLEDPKPSWVTALRPQTGLRQDSTGLRQRWNCQQRWPQRTILFFHSRWRLLDTTDTTVFSPKSSRNSRTTWVMQFSSATNLQHTETMPDPNQIDPIVWWVYDVYAAKYDFSFTFQKKTSNSCDSKNDVIHFPRHRCHVGHLHHTKLFGTIVAQVRSHAANDAWQELVFLSSLAFRSLTLKPWGHFPMFHYGDYRSKDIQRMCSLSTILPNWPTSEGGTTSLNGFDSCLHSKVARLEWLNWKSIQIPRNSHLFPALKGGHTRTLWKHFGQSSSIQSIY